jgi:hypothetical protein
VHKLNIDEGFGEEKIEMERKKDGRDRTLLGETIWTWSFSRLLFQF